VTCARRSRTACAAGLLPWPVVVLVLAGCQSTPKPIFPEISPPIVWPAAPERPRIRYIGALRGESSLGAQPSGWEAVRAALAGPRPQVEFSHPSAIAVAGARVFVADIGLGVVHLLDLDQRRYLALRGSATDPMRVPIDVAVVPGNRLVVVDRGRATVEIFDLDGNWLTTRRWPEIQAPVAAAWDAAENTLWLADAATHACFACTLDGAVKGYFGTRGGRRGEFNFPTALAWHAGIGLVVADAMNFRVQVFDAAGQPTAMFGHKGDAAGDFSRPRGVAIDSDGHIYVVDNQFENVQVFDAQGQLLLSFGQEGDQPGEFSLPAGISIDSRDRIWIADSYNHRVQVFQYLSEKASWPE
jgi:DNA-binding beta-propeller fold protein YncE